jgi:hypothetical protein
MIISYDVVTSRDIAIFKKKVNEMLVNGWQPFENMQVSTPVLNDSVIPIYTQVMVKTGENNS